MEDSLKPNSSEKRTSQPTETVDVYMERLLNNIEENKRKNAILQNKISKQENILTNLQKSSSEQTANTIQSESKFSLPLGSSRGYSLSFKNQREYEQGKERVEVLEKFIAGRWLSEDVTVKEFVDEHQSIAETMLMYEINNDLLPI